MEGAREALERLLEVVQIMVTEASKALHRESVNGEAVKKSGGIIIQNILEARENLGSYDVRYLQSSGENWHLQHFEWLANL